MELEEWVVWRKQHFPSLELINLSAFVINYLEQDIISAYLVIITLIMTVILSLVAGLL